MRINCRIIPVNQLKAEHLAYILLPEKTTWALRGCKSPAEINQALPSFLQQKLSPYTSKPVYTYLSYLLRELSLGQYVVLSWQRQAKPVDAERLKRIPTLAKKVAALEKAPQSYRKAHFSPVSDITSLPRNLTYTPVEPMPEHKIVVEFAGQWGSSAASLSLDKTESQESTTASPKSDHEAMHRSLVHFKGLENANRSLYINIPCSGMPQLQLKLADEVEPVEKETEMDEWDNVLIPVLPVVKQGDQMSLRDSGYIYVIWNDKVWRELEIQPNGYFCDVNLDYFRNQDLPAKRQMRHLNIDGSTLITEGHLGSEYFEVVQNGQVVSKGELSESEIERVFGLIEEEVELRFPNADIEPIMLKTLPSPFKASQKGGRVAEGFPLPHIWVPYKINGEVQSELYLHYSAQALTNPQLAELEADPAAVSTSLGELTEYSNSQAFAESGEKVIKLQAASTDACGAALLNSQWESNIAGVSVPGLGGVTIEYRQEEGTDEPDDFFELRNTEHEWSSKAYFRSAQKNEQGNLMLRFASPPPEVEVVDILRAAHSDHGRGAQHYVVLEKEVPVSELVG